VTAISKEGLNLEWRPHEKTGIAFLWEKGRVMTFEQILEYALSD
jgi:hypothetical protein